MTVPLWLFAGVVAALIAALGVVTVQRDRARSEAGDLRAELSGRPLTRAERRRSTARATLRLRRLRSGPLAVVRVRRGLDSFDVPPPTPWRGPVLPPPHFDD